jgi:hypothetical protein
MWRGIPKRCSAAATHDSARHSAESSPQSGGRRVGATVVRRASCRVCRSQPLTVQHIVSLMVAHGCAKPGRCRGLEGRERNRPPSPTVRTPAGLRHPRDRQRPPPVRPERGARRNANSADERQCGSAFGGALAPIVRHYRPHTRASGRHQRIRVLLRPLA